MGTIFKSSPVFDGRIRKKKHKGSSWLFGNWIAKSAKTTYSEEHF